MKTRSSAIWLGRGTSIKPATEIRRIAAALPERNFKPYIKDAEEVFLRTAWKPLTPDALLESVDNAIPSTRLDIAIPLGAEPKTSNRKLAQRSRNYGEIETALRQIAEANPISHSEVFEFLNGRVPIPHAEPFKTAKGWSAGFARDPTKARSWLSIQWRMLGLPPFRRGPKK